MVGAGLATVLLLSQAVNRRVELSERAAAGELLTAGKGHHGRQSPTWRHHRPAIPMQCIPGHHSLLTKPLSSVAVKFLSKDQKMMQLNDKSWHRLLKPVCPMCSLHYTSWLL